MYHEKLTDEATVEVVKQGLIELNAIRNSFLDSYRSIENLIDEIQDEDNELSYAPDSILEMLEDTCDPARIAAESMDEINDTLETILEKARGEE